jgi:uncharacterized phage protein gp47/JayE
MPLNDQPLNAGPLNATGETTGGGSAGADTTPAPFSFSNQSNTGRSESVISSQITISGIDTPAAVSVAGGLMSIAGGEFTSSNGTIENGQTLRLSHTTSANYSTSTTTTVNVGGVLASFVSTTLAEPVIDTTPLPFTFNPASGVARSIEAQSNTVTISGITDPAPVSVAGGSVSINGGAWTTEPGTITNGQTVQVKHGSSVNYSSSTTTTLTIGGVSGVFVSTTESEPEIDTTPNPISFIAQRNVPPDPEQDSPIQSNQVIIDGITDQVSIDIVSGVGEYQINNGAWLSAQGVVFNGDLVRVRATASADYSTIKGVTLRVGSISAFFSITTEIEPGDSMADPFSFNPLTNRELNSDVTSNPVTISGIAVSVPVYVTDGFYRINGGTWQTAPGLINNGDILELSHKTPGTLSAVSSTKVEVGGTSEVFISVTRDGVDALEGDSTALGDALNEIQDIDLDAEYDAAKFIDSMQAAGIPTTPETLEQAFRAKAIKNGVVFNNDSKFSPFWRLVSALVVQSAYWLIRFVGLVVFPNSYVVTAKKKYLEYLGAAFDLKKNSDQKARGYISFSRDDISQALSVKTGAVVESVPINGEVHSLITIETGEFLPGENTTDILCEATQSGGGHNLPGGYYRNIPKTISGITSVTNSDTWLVVPGFDSESENSFRSRIINAVSANNSDHFVDDVYKKVISDKAGISPSDIFIDSDAPRGPGTANAYILFGFGVSASEYLDGINNHLIAAGNHGLGDDITALAMPTAPVNILGNLRLDQSIEPGNVPGIIAEIELYIRAAFRENSAYRPTVVKPTALFSFSLLASEIHRQFPQVISFWFDTDDIDSAFSIPTISNLSITNHE